MSARSNNIHEQIYAWRRVLVERHEVHLAKKAAMKAAGALLSRPAALSRGDRCRRYSARASAAVRHLQRPERLGSTARCRTRPLHSARILGDACEKLRHFSVEGTRLNRQRIDDMLGRSLMLVTALSPMIGYDKSSAIAHKANDEA